MWAWRALGLMALAGLTPKDWEIGIADENLGVPDYAGLERPGPCRHNRFHSQAPRVLTNWRASSVRPGYRW